MSLTFNTYQSSLANLLVVPVTDPGFQIAFPNGIDYAELRLYRELDLLNTEVSDASGALSTNTRVFNLPSTQGTFVVVDQINIITPAGQTNPDLGTRNPLTPGSMEGLTFLYPNSTGSAVPVYFTMQSQTEIAVAPMPDAVYQVEVWGTIRPQSISSTNTTTLLSVYFPDLFIAASMVFLAGYQKNYGAGVDDPKMAFTWESQYQTLINSAQTEEARKKFTGPGWSPNAPSTIVTPPRT